MAKQVETFFKLLLGPRVKGHMCIATMEPTGDNFKERFFAYPDELDGMLDYIDKYTPTHNVYFCPQLLRSPRRTKDNVTFCTSAWADLDECDPNNLLVKPSVVVESSPLRYQTYWIFEDAQHGEPAQDVSKRIAYYHSFQGADRSGWDLTQLLRVPGTFNKKPEYGEAVVKIETINRNKYRIEDFEKYPSIIDKVDLDEFPYPSDLLKDQSGEEVLVKYEDELPPHARFLFDNEPDKDAPEGWSGALWRLQMILFEANLTREEVFLIARDSACNKYRRDGKPMTYLWIEVCRSWGRHLENRKLLSKDEATDRPVHLLTKEETRAVKGIRTFVEDYTDWASSLGDAAEQYHQAGALVILSALLSGVVRLPTSFGIVKPNLWFMILADCLNVDTPILTPRGWKLMGDIEEGDYVIGSDGQATEVQVVSELKHLKSYKVTFRNGAIVECSGDHLWTISVKPNNGYNRITVPLTKVKEYLEAERNPHVPLITQPVEFTSQTTPLPVDPYILGIWLAEGCRSKQGYSAYFSSDDPELIDNVRQRLPEGLYLTNSGNLNWYIRPAQKWSRDNSIRNGLRDLGLITLYQHQRFIPRVYMTASIEDRIALLQGIMDGDGHSGEGVARLGGVGKQLIDDVTELVQSLGGTAKVRPGSQTSTGKTIWHTNVTFPSIINPFLLKEKAALVTPSKRHNQTIVSIEATDNIVPMKCIKVVAKDGLYVTKDYIVTHNTTLTRKSTAMDITMDLLEEVDSSVILATDGSIEGLMTSLATRPGQASIFLRDEFSGLLDAMVKKDYYAGMAETLTKLYDGRLQKRVLKKEIIEVKDPTLIIFAGGIKDKVCSLLTIEHVSSGFVPRFVFITAVSNVDKVQPLGPPTLQDSTRRGEILSIMKDLKEFYFSEPRLYKNLDGRLVYEQPAPYDAELTPDAWARYNVLERHMMQHALKSQQPEILTPTYDRLSKSALKVAVLIAASRACPQNNTVVVELVDLLVAIKYLEGWRVYTNEIINNVGLTHNEKEFEKILRAIVREPGISRSKLMQRYHLTARNVDFIFSTLEQRGQIDRQKQGGTERLFPFGNRKKYVRTK